MLEREVRTRQQQISLYEDKKIGFLREAVAQGADRIVPKGMSSEQWERQKDIGKAYSYLASMTREELRRIYGRSKEEPLTRERIRQIHDAFIVNLHNNSSPNLQSKFPLEEIFVKKPLSLLRGGTIALEVKRQIEQGVNSRAQILKNTGLTLQQVKRAAETLRKHEVIVPRMNTSWQELEEQFKKEEDNEKLQGMLDEINPYNVRHFMGRDPGKEVFLSYLSDILVDAGFYVGKRLETIATLIRDMGIPVRRFEIAPMIKKGKAIRRVYTIIPTKRRKQILEVLNENPDILGRFNDRSNRAGDPNDLS